MKKKLKPAQTGLPTITPARVRALQAAAKAVWGDSARELSLRLGVSRGQFKHIECGTRQGDAKFARAVRRVELELAADLKAEARLERAARAAIVDLLAAHRDDLTPTERRRMEKVVRTQK